MAPSNSDLYKLFRAAITTGLEYARRRAEANEYIGEHDEWPELTWQKNGLPGLGEAHPGPTDYAGALRARFGFSPEPDQIQPRFEAESSFLSLLEYARADPRLAAHLGCYQGLLETSLRMLIGDIIDRYIHLYNLFILEEGKLLPLYCEIEAYLLTETLPIAILVPVLCLSFESKYLDIDKSAALIEMSDELHLARAPTRKYQYGTDPRVQTAATHALVLKNYTLPNENQVLIWHILADTGLYPLKVINTFFAALRIVTGHPTGYAQLLVRPIGWASGYKGNIIPLETTSTREYPRSFEDGCWDWTVPVVSAREEAEVAWLFIGIRELEEKHSNIGIAIRRLNSSSLRANGEDGLLDAMIGLEALLSDGSQEMTHKIALRLAALYRLEEPVDFDVFKEVKRIYGFRSEIVHGKKNLDIEATLDRGKDKVRIVDAAVEHLRTALGVLIRHERCLNVSRIDYELLIGPSPTCDGS